MDRPAAQSRPPSPEQSAYQSELYGLRGLHSTTATAAATAAATATAAPKRPSDYLEARCPKRRRQEPPPPLSRPHSALTRPRSHSAPTLPSQAPPPPARPPPPPRFLPPINQLTLRELDLAEILNNAQLRHDIVHDPLLHFRPNFDGERGRRKKAAAHRYWLAVAAEVRALTASAAAAAPVRLPVLLAELRHIIAALLPAPHSAGLALDPAGILALDPEGIRALDAPRFAALVAALLRPHIAPAREPLLGDMAASVAAGVASRDPLLIVKGFRILFELLEAMKLDIANHQLQSMRAFLVDTAVDFEQRYFADRISRGKMQLDSTLLWLNRHCKAPALFEGFCTGVVALLELQAPFAQLPQTFQFDQARLSSIRADLHDLLSIQMILLLYRQLICPVTRPAHLDPAILSFKQEILVLIADDIAHSRIKWEKAIPCLALQMARKYAICKTGFCTFPDQHIITSVQSWLLTNLDRKQISPVHQLLQSRVLQYFSKTCLAAIRCNRHFTPISENDSLDSFVGLNDEIQVLARKISGVAVFHYKVMGKLYVRWCM